MYYGAAPTLSIDLSNSWTTSSVAINQISKPPGISGKTNTYRHPGLFWQDSTKSIVVYGGDDYSGKSSFDEPYTIWSFTPSSPSNGDGKWSPTTGRLNDIIWPHNPSSVDTPNGGIVVGGYSVLSGIALPLLNMTIVGKSNSYTGSPDIGPFVKGGVHYGSAHFVPSFGTGEGMIIYIGGATVPGAGRRREDSRVMLSMSTINMYDIASKQWYTQTAGGDIPSGRLLSCISGAQGANTSTYEM